MTTMPKREIHEQHQAMPGVKMMDYLVGNAIKQGTDVPEGLVGEVKAELYRGLWIARCVECSGACTVTSVDPIYMCPDCGAGWFNVVFPTNKAAIEKELLKRPTRRGGRMDYANWNPHAEKGKGETLGQLRFETRNLLVEGGS